MSNPPSSLVKFASQNRALDQHNQGELFFGRAAIDGAPFRSFNGPPAFTEREFEAKTVRVNDPFVAMFSLWDEAQLAEYRDVLDRALNQWATILYIERRWTEQGMQVYIEWSQPYMEDGTMHPSAQMPGSQG